VLPFSTQVRGLKPGRSRQDFSGRKKKCRRFAACTRSLNVTWISTFRQNYRPTFSPTVPPLAARISRVVWTWRHLAAEVVTSKYHEGTRVAQWANRLRCIWGHMLRALMTKNEEIHFRKKKLTPLYTGWSKSLSAPDGCIVIIRCTETFWSPCINRIEVFSKWKCTCKTVMCCSSHYVTVSLTL